MINKIKALDIVFRLNSDEINNVIALIIFVNIEYYYYRELSIFSQQGNVDMY